MQKFGSKFPRIPLKRTSENGHSTMFMNEGKNRRGRCPLEPGRKRLQTFEEALRDGLEELLV
jgi:hypothetical protein